MEIEGKPGEPPEEYTRPRKKEFTLRSVKKAKFINFPSGSKLKFNFPDLVELHLYSNGFLKDLCIADDGNHSKLRRMFKSLPSLEILNLFEDVNHADFKWGFPILKYCRKLKYLALCFPQVGENAFSTDGSKENQLKCLNISGCRNLNTNLMAKICSKFPTLESLNISYTKKDFKVLQMICKRLTCLRELYMDGYLNNAVKQILLQMKRFTNLEVLSAKPYKVVTAEQKGDSSSTDTDDEMPLRWDQRIKDDHINNTEIIRLFKNAKNMRVMFLHDEALYREEFLL